MYPLETSLTGKTGAEDTASETLIRGIFPIVTYCGGYSAGAPPLPIPNREVKPGRADGTAPPGGRVGRCRFLQEEADCTGFRVFSLLSFYPVIPPPLLLSSVTAPRYTCHGSVAFPLQVSLLDVPPATLSGGFRSRCDIDGYTWHGSAVFLLQVYLHPRWLHMSWAAVWAICCQEL